MKHVILSLSLAIVLSSCASGGNKKIQIREYAFNDSGWQVITARLNDTSKTMCSLYGNAAAFNHSMKRTANHVVGEIYKLVTYKQQDHPFWYGSKINGELLQVETVKTVEDAGQIVPVYRVEYADTVVASPISPDTLATVKYMLNAVPAYFP